MPKRYSDGHFLRRIRRTLAADRLEREVRLIPRPDFATQASSVLVEIRTRLEDGGELVGHHNASLPGTPHQVERICGEHHEKPGATRDQIAEATAKIGAALRNGEGPDFLILRYGSDMPLMFVAGADLLDMTGRTFRRTVVLPLGPVPGYWTKYAHIHELEIDIDRKRRTPRGKPRPIMVDGGLAQVLRQRDDGAELLERIVGAVRTAVNGMGETDGQTPITIDGVVMTIDDVPVSAGPRGLRLKQMEIGGAVLTGTTLTLPRQLPETITLAIAGRRLDEVVTPVPLDGSVRILRANARRDGTALTLDLKGIPIDRMMKELNG